MGEKYHWWSPVKKILILVEGQTEEKFVKEILKPYFDPKEIYLYPRNIKGVSKYSLISSDIEKLLKDSSADMVTTMIDLYRLPTDFPRKKEINRDFSYSQKIDFLENEFKSDINHDKFFPYIQLHEFEALLFSDVSHFKKIPNVGSKLSEFEKIVASKEPEEINDLPNTSPSNRIKKILNFYIKDSHGIIVAKSIGLKKMREKCPHFNQWLEKLEE